MATAKEDKEITRTPRSKADSSQANPRKSGKAATSSHPAQAAGKSTQQAINKSAWLTKATDELLKAYDPVELEASSTEVTSAAGFDLVCTYNWNLGKVPSIYVPGMCYNLHHENYIKMPITK